MSGDCMHALTKPDQSRASPRREPLAQVEVLLLFHPNFQSLGPRASAPRPAPGLHKAGSPSISTAAAV